MDINGRKTEQGYSLRLSLEQQGVTEERSKREHLGLIYHSLLTAPRLDITKYRVNKNTPNIVSTNMG